MSKAASKITDKFKCSFVRVANESESVAVQKMMFKLGFRRVGVVGGSRDISDNPDIRSIYVNVHCEMFLYTEEARGNKWREVGFAELSAAVQEVVRIKREESKASKKRRALRNWDATATKKTHGVRPLHKDVLISIKRRDGGVETGRADEFYWHDTGMALDIVSYKVLTPNKHKPKPGTVVTQDKMVADIAAGMGKGVAVVPLGTNAEILDAASNVIGYTSVKERQPAPNECWCVGCNPDNCSGCPPVPNGPVADTNPKRQYGVSSVPLNMWSPLASAYGALGLYNGGLKYGKANFTNTPVEASIYIAAAFRHLSAWAAGQEDDPVDGVPNLGGVLANIAILLEARAAGTLIDDRLLMSGYLKEIEMLKEKVKHLNLLHADKNPRHYTKDQT